MSGPEAPSDYSKLFTPAQEQKETKQSELFISTGLTDSYSLASIDFKSAEYVGERLLVNGDIYVGSWQGSLPDGTGKYLWSDGCMYEGEWEKGKKSGMGRISWPSGATYEGDFMAGYIHGVGSFTGVDGTSYKGSWYMNEKKGLGTKSYANGDVYEGLWNQGVPEGVGKYLWKNGNEYVGDWKSGAMFGRGTLTWASGDKYDGQWLDGLKHGDGVYTWADGSTYVGTWFKGLKDGKGIFVPPRTQSIGGHLPNIHEHHTSWDDTMALQTSQRTSNASVDDHELWVTKVSRMSCRGSSTDRLWYDEMSSVPESEIEGWWSSEKPLINFDDPVKTNISGAHVTNCDDDYHLEDDHDSFDSSVVARNYVKGVLINEVVKEASWLQKQTVKQQKQELVRPGETIFKGHQSYDLMLNLQLGIRYTVGKITPEPRREISAVDYGLRARIWMNFPRDGSQLTPPHQSSDFKWKDYCPMVFRHLRELFNIDSAEYMLSICGDNGLREMSSPGKSGSVFYLSHDDRYMIKTMRKAEVQVLLGMLPNYHEHVQRYENTLITKFFGLHRIKPAGGQKVHFVVMANMFCTELLIHRRFDLKGSSQGRCANKSEMDEHTTLKDLDLDFVFRLEPSWQQEVLRQIECDCKFLESEHIMDYSLLLGIHFRAPRFTAIFSSSSSQPSDPQLAKKADESPSDGLVLVAHEPENYVSSPGLHVRGNPLRTATIDNEEIDLLLPGTARLRIQLGVNMPARADRKLFEGKDTQQQDFPGEAYDVVLYFGIIDILQEYDMGKKLEHAYKSLHFDSFSISAVDPSLYAKRFQDFMHQIFPHDRE